MNLHQPPSIIASPDSSIILELCQRQVDQLVALLPLKTAWIVYECSGLRKQQVVAQGEADATAISSDLTAYFDSEIWLQHDFLCPLVALALAAGSTAYIYPLGSMAPCSNYLLLWADSTLSVKQQQWVAQQALLLRQVLRLDQANAGLRTELLLLEQVLQRVGHQLGNPLALIRLYAETLTLQLNQGPYQEQVSLICQATDRLKTQLTQLLHYGRDCRLHLEPHNLQDILADSLQELTPWLAQNHIHVVGDQTLVSVNVDRVQLKQVFDNLLNNAIAFSPPGSTLTCQWQVYAHEVLVQVQDQGPGLSEADLKQLFKPFYSRREGGKGVGLAIAQKIILDHQGRLWAENLPLGGAQFSFTLPRAQPRSG